MKIHWKTLAISLAVPLGVGAVSAFFTRNGMQYFSQTVNQPALSPPSWLFPIVWTILFLMMGTASYIIAVSKHPAQKKALTAYALQLAVNFVWPLLFFNLKAYLFSFFWIILLWFLVWTAFTHFYKINSTAGKLLIPYLLWLIFAAYLNFGIYLLN